VALTECFRTGPFGKTRLTKAGEAAKTQIIDELNALQVRLGEIEDAGGDLDAVIQQVGGHVFFIRSVQVDELAEIDAVLTDTLPGPTEDFDFIWPG
jgi:hypothetical protein